MQRYAKFPKTMHQMRDYMLKITNRKEGKSVPNAKKRKPLTD